MIYKTLHRNTPTFFLVAIKPASDILMNMKKLIDVTNESYMEGTCCICGLFYSVYWCHTRLVHMRFTAGVNISQEEGGGNGNGRN
jgi:hypothetical protein